MVAQLRPEPAAALPLLLEPDPPFGWNMRRPHDLARRYCGWRVVDGELVRHPDDDDRGALIQHVLVRYCVHGATRQELAQETNYSERQIQWWITSDRCETYAAPVRRALAEVAIPSLRGARAVGSPSERKLHERLAAMAGVLAEAAWLLAGNDRPEAERLRTLCRVLAAGRDPLG